MLATSNIGGRRYRFDGSSRGRSFGPSRRHWPAKLYVRVDRLVHGVLHPRDHRGIEGLVEVARGFVRRGIPGFLVDVTRGFMIDRISRFLGVRIRVFAV